MSQLNTAQDIQKVFKDRFYNLASVTVNIMDLNQYKDLPFEAFVQRIEALIHIFRNQSQLQTQQFPIHKYRNYSKEFKDQVCDDCNHMSIKEVSTQKKVPIKNIKRWMKNREEKKPKTSGRKPHDPEMQDKLFQWHTSEYSEGRRVTNKMLQKKAEQLRTKQGELSFSRGWLDKYKKRHMQFYQKLKMNSESSGGKIKVKQQQYFEQQV